MLILVLIEVDCCVVFLLLEGYKVYDSVLNSFFLFDQLEYQDVDDGSVLVWDVSGWIGGDINCLWLCSEGEWFDGKIEDVEVQVLFGYVIGFWWDLVVGVCQDFKFGLLQIWVVFGVQGLVFYDFEVEVIVFFGENGQSVLCLEGEYDILLINWLIFQFSVEVNLYGRNDFVCGFGLGFVDSELGLCLCYEICCEFVFYIGVIWNCFYGNSVDLVCVEGEDDDEVCFVVGICMWF